MKLNGIQSAFILLFEPVLSHHVKKRPIGSQVIYSNNKFIMDTFAANDVGIRRWGGHLEGQAIGPLEGVTVSDEKRSWILVLQNSYGYSGEETLEKGCKIRDTTMMMYGLHIQGDPALSAMMHEVSVYCIT